MSPDTLPLDRRAALGRLAALLAAGLWPGALRARASGARAGAFTFAVTNDFHHQEAACDPWFAALFRQIRAAKVDFCLGLGDLSHRGQPESMAAIMRLAEAADLRLMVTPGNHDNDVEETTALFEKTLLRPLNYHFEHAGWRFVVFDSTDGKKWGETRISDATLAWLDGEIPKLDPAQPLVLATHFPLAAGVRMCPLNAEDVLGRFTGHNLRLVLSGHFHSRTETERGSCMLVTNVCCSRIAANHDGTTAKGYWLCHAQAEGIVTREFVEFAGVPT